MPSATERRGAKRRSTSTELGERGMRCVECKTVWYSALAPITVRWARCVGCGGALHHERRAGDERRRLAAVA